MAPPGSSWLLCCVLKEQCMGGRWHLGILKGDSRSSQEQPGGARKIQEEPGGAGRTYPWSLTGPLMALNYKLHKKNMRSKVHTWANAWTWTAGAPLEEQPDYTNAVAVTKQIASCANLF